MKSHLDNVLCQSVCTGPPCQYRYKITNSVDIVKIVSRLVVFIPKTIYLVWFLSLCFHWARMAAKYDKKRDPWAHVAAPLLLKLKVL